jgi:hypothetical protein
MTYTYEELTHKTIDELRDIAKGIEHDAVKGYTQMNKEHLLPALLTALHIERHVHHVVVGIDKTALKAQIRQLKGDRDKALEKGDHAALRVTLRKIHHLKRRIRAATV